MFDAHFVNLAVFQGIPKKDAANLPLILNVCVLFTRIFVGLFASLHFVNQTILLAVFTLLYGITTAIDAGINSYKGAITQAILIGIFGGAYWLCHDLALVEVFGMEQLGKIRSIIAAVTTIAAFVGAPLAGHIYDVTGSYFWSMMTAGFLVMLCGVLMFLLGVRHSKKNI